MPFLDYKFFVLLSHVLSFNEFLRLQADRLAQNDVTFNFKYSFAAAMPDVNMDGSVIVAVEKETKAVFGEYYWHFLDVVSSLTSSCGTGDMEARIQVEMLSSGATSAFSAPCMGTM